MPLPTVMGQTTNRKRHLAQQTGSLYQKVTPTYNKPSLQGPQTLRLLCPKLPPLKHYTTQVSPLPRAAAHSMPTAPAPDTIPIPDPRSWTWALRFLQKELQPAGRDKRIHAWLKSSLLRTLSEHPTCSGHTPRIRRSLPFLQVGQIPRIPDSRAGISWVQQ